MNIVNTFPFLYHSVYSLLYFYIYMFELYLYKPQYSFLPAEGGNAGNLIVVALLRSSLVNLDDAATGFLGPIRAQYCIVLLMRSCFSLYSSVGIANA